MYNVIFLMTYVFPITGKLVIAESYINELIYTARMFKKPKIAGYFLFMQEMRRKKPGWANKGNTELQSLCDPLWRKLPKVSSSAMVPHYSQMF